MDLNPFDAILSQTKQISKIVVEKIKRIEKFLKNSHKIITYNDLSTSFAACLFIASDTV